MHSIIVRAIQRELSSCKLLTSSKNNINSVSAQLCESYPFTIMNIKNKTSKAFIVIPIAIIVAASVLATGTAYGLVMNEKKKMTRETAVVSAGTAGPVGTVKCTSWKEIDFEVQSKIQRASQVKGVHPAFLAAIYWKENGERFKPISGPWDCNKYGCGPFQLLRSAGHSESAMMNFSQAVLLAADLAKAKAQAIKVSPSLATSNDAKALSLAYNRGEGVSGRWVRAGFPELTAAKILEYQTGFSPYKRFPVGHPGDFLGSSRTKDTQWWFAEVAYDYVTKFIGTFEGLKSNCQ